MKLSPIGKKSEFKEKTASSTGSSIISRLIILLFPYYRKSRSLFSGAKNWFGQRKPGVATGTSVIYGRDAPELQLRKLADLFFMLKMYKSAYNHYHTAKKDFQVCTYTKKTFYLFSNVGNCYIDIFFHF